MPVLAITDVDLDRKRVLIREDLNVPIEKGVITSNARIRAALTTIEYALQHNAAVIVMSHLGRPKEGQFDPELSLRPVVDELAELLGHPVRFHDKGLENVEVAPGEVVLLENVRFLPGEKTNDVALAKKMADLCDVFVMDAFATAHRAEASTEGVTRHAKIACAGLLLLQELKALNHVIKKPEHPLVAIVGGSKISTKLPILKSLIQFVDQLVVGGGIANTFLAAKGIAVGKSLVETDLIDEAKQLLAIAEQRGATIPLPTDVIVADSFDANAEPKLKSIHDIAANEMILDIGPESAQNLANYLAQAKTILWNGPVGVFEWEAFSHGTQVIANAIAKSPAFSVAGGGDTIAAIEKFGVADEVSYISTGGGAFLEFLEGHPLPAIAALENAAK